MALSNRVKPTTLVVAAIGAASLAIIIFAVAWRATGGHWYLVDSPSMGAAAPVNTVLLDRPAGPVRVGQIITFHPPGSRQIFTHRVVWILPNGAIKTKGDINSSPDTWTLTRSDIIGRVTIRLWDLGWLIRAAPILAVGTAVLWAATHYLTRPDRRLPLRLAGITLIASIAVILVKPLVGDTVITVTKSHGVTYATVVSTKILPIDVDATGGTHIYLSDGHTGTVTTTRSDTKGRYHIHVTPHWTIWSTLITALALLSPALYCTIIGLPPHRAEPSDP